MNFKISITYQSELTKLIKIPIKGPVHASFNTASWEHFISPITIKLVWKVIIKYISRLKLG